MSWSLNKGFAQIFNVFHFVLSCRRNSQIRKLDCIECFRNKILLITPDSNVWNRCVRDYTLPKSFILPYILPCKRWSSLFWKNLLRWNLLGSSILFQKLTPRKPLSRSQILCLELIQCTFSRERNKEEGVCFVFLSYWNGRASELERCFYGDLDYNVKWLKEM